jgi:hypothetical protein
MFSYRDLFDHFRPRFRDPLTPEQLIAKKQAEDDFARRAKAAEEACQLPEGCFRIRGDSQEHTWYVEKACVKTTPKLYFSHESVEAYIDDLRGTEPTASIEWDKLEHGDWESFPTYAKALAFLKEYIQPVQDESVYFNSAGLEVRGGS